MTTNTETTTCDCGTVFEKELATGPHADFLNGLKVWCDDCADTQRRERDEQDRLEEEKERRERLVRRYEVAGLPKTLRDLTFDGLDATAPDREAAVRAASQWSTGEVAGLFLHGPVGTGKSFVAATATSEAIRRGRSVRWMSVPVLLAHMLAPFDTPERERASETLTDGTRGLVLDDLDKVKPSEWAAAQLFAAIDTRVTEGTSLIVTSNLRPTELGQRLGGVFGEAIVSRLAGYCQIRQLDGRDRRLRGAA